MDAILSSSPADVLEPSQWLPDSTLRKPDWRWRRACWLKQGGKRRDHRIDDEWVDRARRVQKSWSRCDTEEERHRLTKRHPAIMMALYYLTNHSSFPLVDELKARLLTDMPLVEVAERVGMPLDTVEAFEALFFDVRGHVGERDWIMSQVIGPDPWKDLERADLGRLWMAFAYLGGPCLLEVVMAITLRQHHFLWAAINFKRDRYLAEAGLRVDVERLAAELKQRPNQVWEALIRYNAQRGKGEGRCTSVKDVLRDFLAIVKETRKICSVRSDAAKKSDKPVLDVKDEVCGGAVEALAASGPRMDGASL